MSQTRAIPPQLILAHAVDDPVERGDDLRGRVAQASSPTDAPTCRAQEVIGGRWNIELVYHIGLRDARRFGELKRAIGGISDSTLSKQLRELERDGLIECHDFPWLYQMGADDVRRDRPDGPDAHLPAAA